MAATGGAAEAGLAAEEADGDAVAGPAEPEADERLWFEVAEGTLLREDRDAVHRATNCGVSVRRRERRGQTNAVVCINGPPSMHAKAKAMAMGLILAHAAYFAKHGQSKRPGNANPKGSDARLAQSAAHEKAYVEAVAKHIRSGGLPTQQGDDLFVLGVDVLELGLECKVPLLALAEVLLSVAQLGPKRRDALTDVVPVAPALGYLCLPLVELLLQGAKPLAQHGSPRCGHLACLAIRLMQVLRLLCHHLLLELSLNDIRDGLRHGR